MKNLFLTLVFVFATAFSFAGSDSYETKLETAMFNDCIGVTLSCGVSYDICNFTGTTSQLVNLVIGQNNNVCGTKIMPVE